VQLDEERLMSRTLRTIAVAFAVALATAGGSTAAFVVTSKSIKNGTIQLVDISPKAKKALRGLRGQRGPQGIQTITEVLGPTTGIPPGEFGGATASCPDGQQPIAGGFEARNTPAVTVLISRRTRSPAGWAVGARNSSPTLTEPLNAFVYCSPNVTLQP
jgi:hypothetical protein